MNKLFSVIVLTLALNFLLVAGGAGWLVKTGHLDKDRFKEVKKILFPPAAESTDAATTQPDATTQPSMRLDQLLARASGRTGAEQVEFMQQTFDAQAAQLDRRQRELDDLQRQVDLAKDQVLRDRGRVEQGGKELASRQEQNIKQVSDKGFQDSLTLYSSMPPKSVKSIFLSLNDEIVQRYLEAMEPRTATKIIKEYKTPEELDRIQKVLERMRTGSAPAQSTAQVPIGE